MRRDLERSGVRVLPPSTFTLRFTLWQKSTNISRSWLCRSTTSPPRLHDNAWCHNGSKAISGQSRQQEEALVVSKPSHHEIAVRNQNACQVHLKEGLRPKKWPKKQRQRGGEICLLEKISHTNCYKTNYPAYGREISVREETRWQILEMQLISSKA